eukprot:CFRG8341T1
MKVKDMMVEHKVSKTAGDSIPRDIVEAVMVNDINKVVRFVETGFDINTTDAWGFTLLHYAASKGHREMALSLLQRNADCFIFDKENRTARGMAIENGEIEMIDLIDTFRLLQSQNAPCLKIHAKANGESTSPVVNPPPSNSPPTPLTCPSSTSSVVKDETQLEPTTEESTTTMKKPQATRQTFCHMCGEGMIPNIAQRFCHCCGVKVNDFNS